MKHLTNIQFDVQKPLTEEILNKDNFHTVIKGVGLDASEAFSFANYL